jgi:Flp pilus assembly pilin Flp
MNLAWTLYVVAVAVVVIDYGYKLYKGLRGWLKGRKTKGGAV